MSGSGGDAHTRAIRARYSWDACSCQHCRGGEAEERTRQHRTARRRLAAELREEMREGEG